MTNLTFGEQVKIILSRKGMTIKRLAEEVEKYTGKPMSRQNMTQRLGRDNFQEQDMRMIAEILGCPFSLSIMDATPVEIVEQEVVVEKVVKEEPKDVAYIKKATPPMETREIKDEAGEKVLVEVNPYTRKEYETNSVRMHPKKIGYIQVYDRETHQWTDMTEWAFLGYQERLKKIMGKDYKEPIYLD